MHNKARFLVLAIGAMVLVASIGLHAQEVSSQSITPHGWVTEHETLKYGNKVLYDRNVPLDDPSSIALNVHVLVNKCEWSGLGVLGNVSVDEEGRVDVHGNLLHGCMITYVVHDLTDAGHATVTLVYTVKDSEEMPGKGGFVVFPVKLGEMRTVTGQDGAKIVITVAKQTD